MVKQAQGLRVSTNPYNSLDLKHRSIINYKIYDTNTRHKQ